MGVWILKIDLIGHGSKVLHLICYVGEYAK